MKVPSPIAQALRVVAAERDDDDVGVDRRDRAGGSAPASRRSRAATVPTTPCSRASVVDHPGVVEQRLQVRPERAGVGVAGDQHLRRVDPRWARPPDARVGRRSTVVGRRPRPSADVSADRRRSVLPSTAVDSLGAASAPGTVGRLERSADVVPSDPTSAPAIRTRPIDEQRASTTSAPIAADQVAAGG